MFDGNFFDRFAGGGNDVQPEKYGPDAVFFADMRRAGAKAFLTAESDTMGIHQIDEVFPAGRHLVIADVMRFGDTADGR